MGKVTEPPRIFYSADSMLRYNPLWAMILGERSVGKSFEFKKRSINTQNSIWVYLRRTDILRKDPKNWKSYLSDLLQKEVIDLDAEYKVNSEGLWVDGVQKVIFSALSTDSGAHSMNYLPDSLPETKRKDKANKRRTRQTGLDFESKEKEQDFKSEREAHTEFEARRIDEAIEEAQKELGKTKEIKKKIVYEEIIEPTGKYIRNEVEQLFEFYVTVDRYTNTQLFGIANLMTSYNPYFEYFGIRPFTQEFKWYKEKTLLVQNVKIKGMEDFVKSQRFYNLVKGTDYGDYLTNNTPWQDDNFAIEKRPPKSKLRYNVRMYGELFGIWEHEIYTFVSSKHNKEYPTFSGLRSIQPGDIPIKRGEGAHKLLNTGLELGTVKFESIPIREMVFDIVNGGYKNG